MWAVFIFLLVCVRIRKTGPNEVRVKNSPVDCFLGHGRIHFFQNASLWDVG